MEQSIENIWKDGFLKNEELIAPKVVNLYNQKSKNIVDRMMRTMKGNIYVLIFMAFAFMLYTILTGLPLFIGIIMFLVFTIPAIISWRELKNLELNRWTSNSYEFLIEFRQWLNMQISKNIFLSRFIYPSSMISAGLIMWYGGNKVELMGNLLEKYPDLPLVGGVPLYFILAIGLLALIMSVFAGKIFRWDVGLVYGRQHRKLLEIISDLEELRR